MKNKRWMFLLFALAAIGFVLVGCSSDDDGDADLDIVDPGPDSVATCEGCHTNEAMLKATVEPGEETPEPAGEG
jgi:hypothetical protein